MPVRFWPGSRVQLSEYKTSFLPCFCPLRAALRPQLGEVMATKFSFASAAAPLLLLLLLTAAAVHIHAHVESRPLLLQPKATSTQKHSSKAGGKKAPALPPVASQQPPRDDGYSSIFDVLSYGAKGDGIADDTHAFQAAWADACKVPSAIVEVPAEFNFLVRPVIFSGPCQPNLVFQVDGTILAPSLFAWNGASLLQWIQFTKIRNMVLQGSSTGSINGNGPAWWDSSCKAQGHKTSKSCDIPTAVRFYGSSNVTVNNLAIVNSPQTHLKFDSCEAVVVHNVSITSPENSPNTDGIHLQDTRTVAISGSSVSAGDDCVSIQTGCSNVEVSNMVCGPGHGISIGSLGRGGSKACVSNIWVHDVVVQNSQNGVRIKTWQGGSGSVSNVSFNNVSIINVSNPIVIDQFYCDGSSSCHNQTSAVSISDISYKNIKGTFTQKNSIRFACSDTVPCVKLAAADIELVSVRGYQVPAFCWNSYGEMHSPTTPQLSCLGEGTPKVSHVQSRSDAC